ncbi:CTC-interacting domain 7 [Abeliophyllum distichum]|uniref:CTC-interacting domain 7 n=1 Tax=Abeliophyllum distichum TaxID=126358 RepID=A0ABD1TZ33_9LAMI
MNLYGKVFSTAENNLSTAKATSLNPNAAEFVPFALRSAAGTSKSDALSELSTSTTATPGKAVLHKSEYSVSYNSDEEAHQHWHHQLPDDITPDFKVMGDDTQGVDSLSFLGLSLTDASESLRDSTGSGFMLTERQELYPQSVSRNSYTEKLRHPISSYGNYPSPTGFQHSFTKPWDKKFVSNGELLASIRKGPPNGGNSRHSFLADMPNEQLLMDSTEAHSLDFLASQFPGLNAESLAQVYFTNGGDVNLTIEILTQLELQVDGGLNQNQNSKALPEPNLSAFDLPAISLTDGQHSLPKFSGDDLQQKFSPYWSSEKERTHLFRSNFTIPSSGDTDLASAVRKMAPQDSVVWKDDLNGSSGSSIGSGRSSQVPAGSYNSGQGKGVYVDSLQNRGSARSTPVWLETGEAVANTYSELREEARDHTFLHNTYVEQARQAYLIGNKALAKESSIKEQLHNMQMKAAYGKAQESIYHQRNPEAQGNRGERMIDLQGLHVSEAIHFLKHELAVMRIAARSVDQRLLVYICVGTGHHTRGPRTPARLPAAVQHYLLEEEGLNYSEPEPGLLRVLIY